MFENMPVLFLSFSELRALLRALGVLLVENFTIMFHLYLAF
jgi:hypothetical protein